MNAISYYKYEDWTIAATDKGKIFSKIISQLTDSCTVLSSFRILEILKDDHRSLVALIKYHGEKYIFKIPREKNRRKWIRFTTIYRKSEVEKTITNLIKLKSLGIASNDPVLFAEKRKRNFTVDSFIIYSNVEGKNISKMNYNSLMAETEKLHQKGYIHGDFHSSNFLYSANKIYFLDTSLKKNIWGSLGSAYEMIYFLRNKNTLQALKQDHREYINHRFNKIPLFVAHTVFCYVTLWRRFKRLVFKNKYQKIR